ncbi:MAG: hypothetical protein NVS9B15_20220 [Acidobacteriaceae bacterium]
MSFLVDHMLERAREFHVDRKRVGAVGHSFGGWTVLAALETDARIGAVVALAPAGSSRPRPGIIPAQLSFEWKHEVPVLYVAAEKDTSIPVENVRELLERTRTKEKRMVILQRADHMHFMDDVERRHEAVRAMEFPEELKRMQQEMLPMEALASGEEAHRVVRALAHFDATLKGRGAPTLAHRSNASAV